jgi:hypothetical protein
LLAGEGHSLRQSRKTVRQIREVTSYDGIELMQRARVAAYQMGPALSRRMENGVLGEKAQSLREALNTSTFYELVPQIRQQSQALSKAYYTAYRKLHRERTKQFEEVIETVKGRQEWMELPEEMYAPVLKPLASRACSELDLPPGTVVCQACSSNMSQMDSDLAALPGLQGQVLVDIQKRVTPDEKFERVRLLEFFAEPLDSEEAISQTIDRLRDHLQKLMDQGIKIILE